MTNSTDPYIQIQGDVSVNKKRAAVDGQVLQKRMSCILNKLFKYSGESTEDFRIHRGKTKASDGGEAPEKKRKCSHKKSSCISTYLTLSRASISNSSESSADIQRDVRAEHFGVEFSQTLQSILTEEENLCKMSSSGNSKRVNFEFKYKEIAPISTGGFGSVYSGIRQSDQLPFPIKHIDQKTVERQQVTCKGETYDIILEVALMLKAAGPPGEVGQSAAMSLLDWYTLDSELILVIENPTPCKDLLKYLQASRGPLDEHEAKIVFFNQKQSEDDVGTIDNTIGTHIYAPPEWLDYRRYQACPTTVWQLGALFYSLLPGHGRFTTSNFINNDIKINKKLSRDCRTLLHMCLTRDPMERATLKELQHSPALK